MKNKDKKTLKKRTIEIDNTVGTITFTETEIESSDFLKELILEETKHRRFIEKRDLESYYSYKNLELKNSYNLENLKENNKNKAEIFSIWFGFIYIILVLISIIVMAFLKISLIYIAGIIVAFSFLIGATKFGNKKGVKLEKTNELNFSQKN